MTTTSYSRTHQTQKPQVVWEATLKPTKENVFPSSFSHSFKFSLLSHLKTCFALFHPLTIFSLSVLKTLLFSFLCFPALCFDFSPRPTSLSLYFAGSQGALYPPDTIPSIHITSRDSDTNYLKGPLGCTTPWSRGWRENRDRWTESWEKYEGHLSLD